MVEYSTEVKIYETMLRIRKFEEKIIQLYAEGFIPGHVHLYIGEEPIAAAVCMHLKKEDYVFSTHRPHGHLIAKGASLNKMMAEIFGKENGYNHGKGGHMHIMAKDVNVFADAIVGSGFAPAVGAALSFKLLEKNNVSVCFFGDGAANQGLMYESLNMASIWNLPVIFICENNKYALSTPVEVSTAGPGISVRAKSFGIESYDVDGYNPMEVFQISGKVIAKARNKKGPSLLNINTCRLRGHREGDPQTYRSREEIKKCREKDPVKCFHHLLKEKKLLNQENEKEIYKKIDYEIKEAVEYAMKSNYPSVQAATSDLFSS